MLPTQTSSQICAYLDRLAPELPASLPDLAADKSGQLFVRHGSRFDLCPLHPESIL